MLQISKELSDILILTFNILLQTWVKIQCWNFFFKNEILRPILNVLLKTDQLSLFFVSFTRVWLMTSFTTKQKRKEE